MEIAPRSGLLRFLPQGATHDASRLLTARATWGIGDGVVSVLLPVHLAALGFGSVRVGIIATVTLLGSAAITLSVGLLAGRFSRRWLLRRATVLMVLTGLGFAFVDSFWLLLPIAFVGTLNPSTGDVSVFLPTEQALLPQTVPEPQRTALFARYSRAGSLAAAIGALIAGWPAEIAERVDIDPDSANAAMFGLYSMLGLLILWTYRDLSPRSSPLRRRAASLWSNHGQSCCGWPPCSASTPSPVASWFSLSWRSGSSTDSTSR